MTEPDGPDRLEEASRRPGRKALLVIVAFVLTPAVALLLGLAGVLLTRVLSFSGASGPAFTALAGTLLVEAGIVGLIALLARPLFGRPFLEQIRWTRRYPTPTGRLVLGGIAVAFTVMVASALFPPSDPPIQNLLNTPQAIAVFALFGIAVAPLVEEIIFRGFYFSVLRELAGAAAAIPATAALFMLMHAPQLWGSWPAIFIIFLVGCVLSVLRHRTDSLIPPFIVHTAYNATLFVASGIGLLLGEPIQ